MPKARRSAAREVRLLLDQKHTDTHPPPLDVYLCRVASLSVALKPYGSPPPAVPRPRGLPPVWTDRRRLIVCSYLLVGLRLRGFIASRHPWRPFCKFDVSRRLRRCGRSPRSRDIFLGYSVSRSANLCVCCASSHPSAARAHRTRWASRSSAAHARHWQAKTICPCPRHALRTLASGCPGAPIPLPQHRLRQTMQPQALQVLRAAQLLLGPWKAPSRDAC